MSEPKQSPWNRVALIAAGLFLLCAIALLFDIQITRNRRSSYIPGDLRRIVQLCEIFAHGFGIALAMYVIWVVAPAKRKWLPRLAACAILPGLAAQFVKLFVVRYRPAHFFPEYAGSLSETWIGFLPAGQLNFEYGTQSFPSAHAATAVGLAIGLTWLLPSCRKLFITLALLASIQRIVAGAHWLSDVFAGAGIAVIICGLIFYDRRTNGLLTHIENRWQEKDEALETISLAEDQPAEKSRAA